MANSLCNFVMAEPHLSATILEPQDRYLEKIAPTYNELKNWSPTQYSLLMQFSKIPMKLTTIIQNYSEFQIKCYEGPSLEVLINSNQELIIPDEILKIGQALLRTKAPRIVLSRIYRDHDKTEENNPQQARSYIRYLGSYKSNLDPKAHYINKLSERQDFMEFSVDELDK
jgi:hypothetical protein